MFRSARAGGARTASVLLVAALWCCFAGERVAWAQACCVSAGLVQPARLRSDEDYALGLEARGRSMFGAFNAGGGYQGTQAGESEWNLEQLLFGVARLTERGQLALALPFVQTRRSLSGVGTFGGGLGDVFLSGRYDFIVAGEHRVLPGVALLLGAVAPTGTPPEEATDLWAAGATGQGSWEGQLGLGLEEAFGRTFLLLNGTYLLRMPRAVSGVRQSFAPRFMGLLAVGRLLSGGSTAGGFLSAMRQGENSDGDGRIPGSGSSLVTAGLAGTISPAAGWRLQGTVFANLPLAGWGSNQMAGAGASASLIRLWP